jgi:hypothetical protein
VIAIIVKPAMVLSVKDVQKDKTVRMGNAKDVARLVIATIVRLVRVISV